jgi:hypothetical protein
MNDVQILEQLARIEAKLDEFLQQRRVQDFYSTADVARILDKAEFTVREWCRLGRVHAEKRACGRGNAREWMIPHDELVRIQCEGLLPEGRATA